LKLFGVKIIDSIHSTNRGVDVLLSLNHLYFIDKQIVG